MWDWCVFMYLLKVPVEPIEASFMCIVASVVSCCATSDTRINVFINNASGNWFMLVRPSPVIGKSVGVPLVWKGAAYRTLL